VLGRGRMIKIVLYGAMVNSLYTIAKLLNNNNINADYLMESCDTFPAHHPMWLDIFHLFKPEDIISFKENPSKFLEQLGWKPNPWTKFPDTQACRIPYTSLTHIKSSILRFLYWRYQKNNKFVWNDVEKLIKYYLIIVCSSNGLISARLSGKPYIVWTYGAEFRIYQNSEKYRLSFMESIKYTIFRKLIIDSINNASAIVSNPPFKFYSEGATNITNIKKCFHHKNIHEIIYPILNYDTKKIDIALDTSKINILIPSRFDFYWKGQDIFLNALAKCKKKNTYHVFFLAWGQNQHEGLEYVKRLNLIDKVFPLPFFATRPALLNLIELFDLIVDDFVSGAFGSIVQEACTRHKAVMTYIDHNLFSCRQHIPPVINVHTEEEVIDALDNISTGHINLKALGEKAYEWQMQNASDEVFIKNFKSLIKSIKIR
jgi:hypothetical protein